MHQFHVQDGENESSGQKEASLGYHPVGVLW